MAQLRQDYDRFQRRNSQVVAIAPDSLANAGDYFLRHQFPFPVLADPDHDVFDSYDVLSKLLSLGQRPALFIIDKKGIVRYTHLGTQQWQIPTNELVLEQLNGLNDDLAR